PRPWSRRRASSGSRWPRAHGARWRCSPSRSGRAHAGGRRAGVVAGGPDRPAASLPRRASPDRHPARRPARRRPRLPPPPGTAGRAAGGREAATTAPAEAITTAAPATTTTTQPVDLTALRPPAPAGDPLALAQQIAEAEGVVRRPDATEAEVAEAALAQQVAYRTLGDHPEWDAAVAAALPPELVPVAQGHAAARRDLRALVGAPATEMPAWRIVAPPPADELLGWFHEAEATFGVRGTCSPRSTSSRPPWAGSGAPPRPARRAPCSSCPRRGPPTGRATSTTTARRSGPPPGTWPPTARPTTWATPCGTTTTATATSGRCCGTPS